MGREERKALIERLQELRGSRVLTYVTSDRSPTPAQIGDDAVRPLYDHLREFGRVEKLDFFIYSRGGAIDVPWRIVTALRQASQEWHILIPFRANSAATLLALGADSIVLGHQGELGPIDPIMNIQRVVTQPGGQSAMVQENVNVEDLMAYMKFVRERAGLSDQAALSGSLMRLTDRLDAVGLGSAYRTHSHIRDVARRMLLGRTDPPTEQTMATIIETLAEKVYAHGHAIGLKDAQEIGLPVVPAPEEVEAALWDLLLEYETQMKLLDPIDPVAVLQAGDLYQDPAVIAIVESDWAAHSFEGVMEVRAKRQMPPSLNVNLNLNLQFPQNVNVSQLPAAIQQMLQQAQQAILQQAQLALQQALRDQAPLAGIEAAFRGGKWSRTP